MLVTGASGQLGRSIKNLVEKSKVSHSFIFVSRDQLDLSYLKGIRIYFKDHKFDLMQLTLRLTKLNLMKDKLI